MRDFGRRDPEPYPAARDLRVHVKALAILQTPPARQYQQNRATPMYAPKYKTLLAGAPKSTGLSSDDGTEAGKN